MKDIWKYKKTLKYFDYIDIRKYIETKYNIDMHREYNFHWSLAEAFSNELSDYEAINFGDLIQEEWFSEEWENEICKLLNGEFDGETVWICFN